MVFYDSLVTKTKEHKLHWRLEKRLSGIAGLVQSQMGVTWQIEFGSNPRFQVQLGFDELGVSIHLSEDSNYVTGFLAPDQTLYSLVVKHQNDTTSLLEDAIRKVNRL